MHMMENLRHDLQDMCLRQNSPFLFPFVYHLSEGVLCSDSDCLACFASSLPALLLSLLVPFPW